MSKSKNTKAIIAGVAAVGAVAALSYVGYRFLKGELDKFDDIDWGNLDDVFNPKNNFENNDLQ